MLNKITVIVLLSMSDTIHWQSKPGFLLGASFLILKDLELINQITRKLTYRTKINKHKS